MVGLADQFLGPLEARIPGEEQVGQLALAVELRARIAVARIEMYVEEGADIIAAYQGADLIVGYQIVSATPYYLVGQSSEVQLLPRELQPNEVSMVTAQALARAGAV